MINVADFRPKASFWVLFGLTLVNFFGFIIFAATKIWVAAALCLILNLIGLGLTTSIFVSFFKVIKISKEIDSSKTESDNYTALSLEDAHDILNCGAIESKDKGVVVLTND